MWIPLIEVMPRVSSSATAPCVALPPASVQSSATAPCVALPPASMQSSATAPCVALPPASMQSSATAPCVALPPASLQSWLLVRVGALLLALSAATPFAFAKDDFLPPEQAYQYSTRVEGDQLVVTWKVEP